MVNVLRYPDILRMRQVVPKEFIFPSGDNEKKSFQPNNFTK